MIDIGRVPNPQQASNTPIGRFHPLELAIAGWLCCQNVTLKQASLCHHRSRLQLTWLLASSRDFTHRHACVNMPMGAMQELPRSMIDIGRVPTPQQASNARIGIFPPAEA
ncbi:hypothetical protein HanHA300_Chr00c0610g0790741 [Helianthus annuus]|nr:hypothetical protein HanHA300_Chr00c0610g0790741 [Helianthus annuus]